MSERVSVERLRAEDWPRARERIETMTTPEPNTGCWLWLGQPDPASGYCRISFNSRGYMAHRLSFEAFNETAPAELLVCHRCDVRCCVNPAHLFLGTYLDNAQDMVRKNRQARGIACGVHTQPNTRAFGDRNGSRRKPEALRRGADHPAAKLSASDVVAICLRSAEGHTNTELAKVFQVTRHTIGLVTARKIWRHL